MPLRGTYLEPGGSKFISYTGYFLHNELILITRLSKNINMTAHIIPNREISTFN
jgi:hypothetical protein